MINSPQECNRYYRNKRGKIILEEFHKLWKEYLAHLKDLCQRKEKTQLNKIITIVQTLKWCYIIFFCIDSNTSYLTNHSSSDISRIFDIVKYYIFFLLP